MIDFADSMIRQDVLDGAIRKIYNRIDDVDALHHIDCAMHQSRQEQTGRGYFKPIVLFRFSALSRTVGQSLWNRHVIFWLCLGNRDH
jgi:hypothetical protein